MRGAVIKVKSVPRSRDEEVLKWLRLRDQGLGPTQIATICGGNETTQTVATNLKRIDQDMEKFG
ncbi:MAG: hypothetical protein EP341_03785 [Sphingomonadales bacterium]|nr:MAG: hypothetical protein EP341_03785 [Sphingomonadales bacterium]